MIARIRELASPGIMMSGSKEEGALFGTIRRSPCRPAARWLVTRRHGTRLVQLAVPPQR